MNSSARWLLALTAAFLIPVIYQNCAPVEPEEEDLRSIYNSTPFAFESRVDTLAMMTCANAQVPAGQTANNPFFTFQALAHNSGFGIRLNNEIRTYAQKSKIADVADLIRRSPENLNAYAHLSVRNSNNNLSYSNQVGVGQFWSISGTSWPLTNNDILSALIPTTSYVNSATLNYRFGGSTVQSTEKFRANINATLANENAYVPYILRDYHLRQQNDFLSITYSNDTSSAAQKVNLGSRFKITLRKPSNISGTLVQPIPGGPISVDPSFAIIQSVEEQNLFGTTAGASWTCTEAIITPNTGTAVDAPGVCGSWTPGSNSKTTDLRRVLNAEQWDINTDGTCVRPKQSGFNCYKSNLTPIYPTSSPQTCNINGINSTTANNQFCPHYVSVCKRQ
jgi:hypothetical protein